MEILNDSSGLRLPRLYLLRHGETDWNVIKRLQGRTDIPINERGQAQARRHGQALRTRLIDQFGFTAADLCDELTNWHFVSSPLSRCRETMEIVRGELGLDPKAYELSNNLVEIGFGDWEGRSWDELRLEIPELIAARFANPWDVVAPKGESHTQMQTRVLDWFEALPLKTIAVTHSGPLRIIEGHLSNMDPIEIPHLVAHQDKFLDVCKGNGGNGMAGFAWV